ncbi:MAG: hypothetical protein LBL27_00190 [Coriobacteriales bacterium]|jgi:hypothetical protein|nr:hypothetical protein [Coriobacteriales bacterium]
MKQRPVQALKPAPSPTPELTPAPKQSSGQHPVPHPVQFLFIIFAMALLLIPSVGMTWARTDGTTENRELATIPSLTSEDGEINAFYPSELGVFFEDHFAYRNEAVSLNARLRASIFGVSASDQVVVGSDGWLYFGGTIDDYVGATPLTERELRSIAHNLFLMQTYAEAQGAQFAFTIAPNKNSLYPEHMPAFYLPSPEASNASRLVSYLEEYGVNYVDSFSVLESAKAGVGGVKAGVGTGTAATNAGAKAGGAKAGASGGPVDDADTPIPLYLLRDSHWNNWGAYLVDTALAENLRLAPLEADEWTKRVDSVGDLDSMLFPDMTTPESQFYLMGINDEPTPFSEASAAMATPAAIGDVNGWAYAGEAHDVETDLSQTKGEGTGVLVAYRDSFGNALLPYLATQTSSAEFSKLVPYNALRVSELKADYVLVERAERHIDYLAQAAPIMPCPTVPIDTGEAKPDTVAQEKSTCEVGKNGPLVSVSGEIDPRIITNDSVIYVSLEQDEAAETNAGKQTESPQEYVFETFMLSSAATDLDNGYLAYFPETLLLGGKNVIKVFVSQGDELFLIQSVEYHE